MSALDRVVSQTISSSSAALTRTGFGTPMLLGYHNEYSDRVREYSAGSIVTDMIADGFASYDPLVRMAGVVASQSPAPAIIKIGKTTAPDQVVTVTPVVAGMVTGETFTMTIRYHNDTTESITPIAYNGTDTVADICDKLVTALAALTGAANIDVTDNTTSISIAPDSALPDGSLIGVEDTGYAASTVRLLISENYDLSGIATDIANIILEDDDWYCALCVYNSHAIIDRIAAAIEPLTKIFIASSSDSACYDSGSTTDVAYGLHASSYLRTGLIWHQYPMEFAAAAWASGRLAQDPGAEIWAFKTLSGPTVSVLSESRKTALENKGANYYANFAGRNITMKGTAAYGLGYFLDATRDKDWVAMRMQEDVFVVFASNLKVPKTDAGIAMVTNAMNGLLQYGVTKGVISAGTPGDVNDPEPLAWGPKIADINATDLANRNLPDLYYRCRITGGFIKALINGTMQI